MRQQEAFIIILLQKRFFLIQFEYLHKLLNCAKLCGIVDFIYYMLAIF